MSTIRDKFIADKAVGALWDVTVSMKRGNPLPLDSNSVFMSYEELEVYATSNPVAYPGQVVAVVAENNTDLYYLDQNLNIQVVGSGAIDPDSLPGDIKIVIDENGAEKLALTDQNGNRIGNGVELPKSGAMGMESQIVEAEDGSGSKMVEVWLTDENGDKIANSETRFAGVGGGGGGTGSSTVTVERITQSPLIITPKDKAIIEFNFSSVDDPTSASPTYYGGEYMWKIGSQTLISGVLTQGKNTFDMTKYVTAGLTTKLSLVVVDDVGTTVTRVWNVQVIDIRVETDFNDKQIFKMGESVTLSYIIYGALNKTIHFKLDGQEIGTVVTEASGRSQTFSINGSRYGNAHKAGVLQIYVTASINNQDVTSESIYKNIIWYDETSDEPLIGCIYRKDYYGTLESQQYGTKTIPFYIYDPTTSSPQITKEVGGIVVSEETLDSPSSTWAFKSSAIGEHVLIIRCRTTYVEIAMNINELDVEIEQPKDYAFDFNPSGKSNNSADRLWVENTNSDIKMSVSENFDWNSGGYQLDENGCEYFCVKAGTRATINYRLLASANIANGASFKIIFKTTNVSRADASFLTSVNDIDAPGFKMNVHEAYFYTNSDSLYAPYSENDIIEFEYVINKLSDEDNAVSYVMTYEDGVASRPLVFDRNSILKQEQQTYITIGSEYCDVHIYRMRAYTTAIEDTLVLSNFIADALTPEEMIARHTRNQIYENGVLDPDKLAIKCPHLRIIKIEAPWFTEDKDDKVTDTTIQMIYKNGRPVEDNWICTGALHSGQGTSSNEYGYAGRNLDLIMNGDGAEFTYGDGTKHKTITLTKDSVPVDYLNIKVNIASSENQNNAQMANRYNRYNPYTRIAKENNPNIKDCMEFYNCVIFVKETDKLTRREFEGDEENPRWHFYAIGNVGDSKKTDKTRVDDAGDSNECIVEIKDFNKPLSVFPRGTGEWEAGNEYYDILHGEQYYKIKEGKIKSFGSETYEFRYEKKGISIEQQEKNINAWRAFYNFVVTSTDEEFKENLSNYFVVDSALYYYLFTERYTMVDNRAKNSFWHYSKRSDGVYRWDLCFGYDFDTCLGIDNTGKLILPYGKEDTDVYDDNDPSSAYIYRAAESTFFTRLRRLFKEELKSMFTDRESQNAWSASELIKQWDDMQSEFPEELWRLDIERKYIRTFKGISIDGSINKGVSETFLRTMLNGRKKYQRRQFERNQELYFATKYFGTAATSDQIRLRFSNPINPVVPQQFSFTIKPYLDMYIAFSFSAGHKDNFRAKAGSEYTINYPESTSEADITLIYGASAIQEIGDLSRCYVGDNEFGKAVRLQSLVLGNTTDGYTNNIIEYLAIGNNKLLEYLDIRNVTGLKGQLNLSSCQNLEELQAMGSNISGVSFAKSCRLQTAKLPKTVNSLYLNNLYNLSDFELEPGGVLYSLTALDVTNAVDVRGLIETHQDTLTVLNVNNISWTIYDTNLLNKLERLEDCTLKGKITIEEIKESEWNKFKEKWPDLEIYYTNKISQYKVTYINDDENNTVLYDAWVDAGSNPPDPTDPKQVSNPIPIPTKEATAGYTYVFKEWSGIDVPVQQNKTIKAVYTANVRYYTVTWYKAPGSPKLYDGEFAYGSDVQYAGEALTTDDDPAQGVYRLFAGWDKNTGFIKEDTHVYAKWETGVLSDIIDTVTHEVKKDIKDMTVGELHAMSSAVISGDYVMNDESLPDGKDFRVVDRDTITLPMGHTCDFVDKDNKNTFADIVSLDSPEHFDGGKGSGRVVADNLIFGSKSFTLAVEYTFDASSTQGYSLFSIGDGRGNAVASLDIVTPSTPNVKFSWSDQSVIVDTYESAEHNFDGVRLKPRLKRNILVIRYDANASICHLYNFANGSDAKYAFDVSQYRFARKMNNSEYRICLGGIEYADGIGMQAKGIIHWCRIWHDDLGDTNAKMLATWTHERIVCEYYGSQRYKIDGSRNTTAASFIAAQCTDRAMQFNQSDNIGGWEKSKVRSFLQSKLTNGVPSAWRQLIKTSTLPSASRASASSDFILSNVSDKIYLPAVYELVSEGSLDIVTKQEASSTIPWLAGKSQTAKRLRFPYVPNTYVQTDEWIINDTDPSTIQPLATGAIWRRTTPETTYIYISEQDRLKFGVLPYAETTAIDGSIGGWITSDYFWERSVVPENTTHAYSGRAHNSYAHIKAAVAESYRLVICFSI